MSKVIRVRFGFAILLPFVIGLKNSRHFSINQTVNPKLIVTCSHSVSRFNFRVSRFVPATCTSINFECKLVL